MTVVFLVWQGPWGSPSPKNSPPPEPPYCCQPRVENSKFPKVGTRGCKRFLRPGSEKPLALVQNKIAPVQNRFRKVQETLGTPLLPGSERPFAPSRNHCRGFPIFDPLSQAARFATLMVPFVILAFRSHSFLPNWRPITAMMEGYHGISPPRASVKRDQSKTKLFRRAFEFYSDEFKGWAKQPHDSVCERAHNHCTVG